MWKITGQTRYSISTLPIINPVVDSSCVLQWSCNGSIYDNISFKVSRYFTQNRIYRSNVVLCTKAGYNLFQIAPQ